MFRTTEERMQGSVEDRAIDWLSEQGRDELVAVPVFQAKYRATSSAPHAIGICAVQVPKFLDTADDFAVREVLRFIEHNLGISA